MASGTSLVSVQEAFDELRNRVSALESVEAADVPSDKEKARFQWLVAQQNAVTVSATSPPVDTANLQYTASTYDLVRNTPSNLTVTVNAAEEHPYMSAYSVANAIMETDLTKEYSSNELGADMYVEVEFSDYVILSSVHLRQRQMSHRSSMVSAVQLSTYRRDGTQHSEVVDLAYEEDAELTPAYKSSTGNAWPLQKEKTHKFLTPRVTKKLRIDAVSMMGTTEGAVEHNNTGFVDIQIIGVAAESLLKSVLGWEDVVETVTDTSWPPMSSPGWDLLANGYFNFDLLPHMNRTYTPYGVTELSKVPGERFASGVGFEFCNITRTVLHILLGGVLSFPDMRKGGNPDLPHLRYGVVSGGVTTGSYWSGDQTFQAAYDAFKANLPTATLQENERELLNAYITIYEYDQRILQMLTAAQQGTLQEGTLWLTTYLYAEAPSRYDELVAAVATFKQYADPSSPDVIVGVASQIQSNLDEVGALFPPMWVWIPAQIDNHVVALLDYLKETGVHPNTPESLDSMIFYTNPSQFEATSQIKTDFFVQTRSTDTGHGNVSVDRYLLKVGPEGAIWCTTYMGLFERIKAINIMDAVGNIIKKLSQSNYMGKVLDGLNKLIIHSEQLKAEIAWEDTIYKLKSKDIWEVTATISQNLSLLVAGEPLDFEEIQPQGLLPLPVVMGLAATILDIYLAHLPAMTSYVTDDDHKPQKIVIGLIGGLFDGETNGLGWNSWLGYLHDQVPVVPGFLSSIQWSEKSLRGGIPLKEGGTYSTTHPVGIFTDVTDMMALELIDGDANGEHDLYGSWGEYLRAKSVA